MSRNPRASSHEGTPKRGVSRHDSQPLPLRRSTLTQSQSASENQIEDTSQSERGPSDLAVFNGMTNLDLRSDSGHAISPPTDIQITKKTPPRVRNELSGLKQSSIRESSRKSSTSQLSRKSSSSSAGTGTSSSDNIIHLRVAGLGHYCEIDISPTATLSQLKSEVEKQTDLPNPYQRLVAKRKKMDDDTMVLGPTIIMSNDDKQPGSSIEKIGIGLEGQTKILLLHSPLYAKDKEGLEKLTTYLQEINKIDTKFHNKEIDNKTVQELIIQVCCKIDSVETNGSEELRKIRKRTVRKAENVAHRSEREEKKNARGVDP